MQQVCQTFKYQVEYTPSMKIEDTDKPRYSPKRKSNCCLTTVCRATAIALCLEFVSTPLAGWRKLVRWKSSIFTLQRVQSDPTINFRKHNTKGKLQTRTIPVIEDLRSLLTAWKPNIGKTYLFPGRHHCHHWHHLHSNSADRILREAFERVGIEGASTHSFRRTALTQMSNAGIPLRVIQEISGHRNLEQLQRYLEVSAAGSSGAIASLSMLSYAGKNKFPHVEDELPAVPLPREQLSQAPSDAAQEIPDW